MVHSTAGFTGPPVSATERVIDNRALIHIDDGRFRMFAAVDPGGCGPQGQTDLVLETVPATPIRQSDG